MEARGMGSGRALGQSAPSMAVFAKAKLSAIKIYQIIGHKPEIERNRDSGTELQSIADHVERKNADFAYPSKPDILILNNFSLNVAARKTMALVGSSGFGKSTVVSLIERFYDPIVGEVLLDGHDITTMKLRGMMEHI